MTIRIRHPKDPYALKVLSYFDANPDEELSNDDIEAKFGPTGDSRSIYKHLVPVVKSGLLETRHEGRYLIYSASLLKPRKSYKVPVFKPLVVDPITSAPVIVPMPEPKPPTPTPTTALATQIGGNHYTKLAIQPMAFSMENQLDACQHTIIKYVVRFRDKNGLEDLLKAKHVIDMLIDFESAKSKPDQSIITAPVRERMESAQ